MPKIPLRMKHNLQKAGLVCAVVPMVPIALCIAPIWLLSLANSSRRRNKQMRKTKNEVECEKQPLRWPAPLGPRNCVLSTPSRKPSRQQRKSPHLTFRLFMLPVELRLAIYDLVLEMKDIHLVASHSKSELGKPGQYQLKSYWGGVPSDDDYKPRQTKNSYSHGCVMGRRYRMGYTLHMPPNQTFHLGIMNLLLTCRML
jgi:hypothetical protein